MRSIIIPTTTLVRTVRVSCVLTECPHRMENVLNCTMYSHSSGGVDHKQDERSAIRSKPMESPNRPTFSDAIDEIGMGPFQSRLLLVCGMVSSYY